jgi:hypothetical protein
MENLLELYVYVGLGFLGTPRIDLGWAWEPLETKKTWNSSTGLLPPP